MANHGSFLFERCDFDPASGDASFEYRYESGPSFIETYKFPAAARPLSQSDLAALTQSVRLLFLLAGVSYYKAYVPERLACRAFALDAATAAFVQDVYEKGLGEFAHRNGLDLAGKVILAAEDVAGPRPQRLSLARHNLVPVGGGKDSIVTVECLRRAGEALTLFALSGHGGIAEPIRATIAAADLPAVHVRRRLSPVLAGLNEAGAYNGHIPITAIVSAAAAVSAILRGFSTIVFSNEHSASAPNLIKNGIAVNHQFSKSLEFEEGFSGYLRQCVSPDLTYFSLLRPLTETAITSIFAKLEKYHFVFGSCNAAFRQSLEARGKGWCCDCPKCRFVFLALAPFLPKPRLVDIFGKNLLADEAQIEGFAELSGISAHKPFECVGEIEESAALLDHLARQPGWRDDAVIRQLAPRIARSQPVPRDGFSRLFEIKPPHRVADRYIGLIDAHL
jgi:hypothetical protein